MQKDSEPRKNPQGLGWISIRRSLPRGALAGVPDLEIARTGRRAAVGGRNPYARFSFVFFVSFVVQRFSDAARSSSLTDVRARVFSSTRLTMMAAFRLWLPSAAGRLPATTTEPAGTRPVSVSPVSRS